MELHSKVEERRVWIKDTAGRFRFACDLLVGDAGGPIIGRLDAELPWAARASEYAVSDAEAQTEPTRFNEWRHVGGGEIEICTTRIPLLGARGEILGTLGWFDPVGGCRGRATEGCHDCSAKVRQLVRSALDGMV